MIVEIRDINTDAMCVIVASLRELGMKDLAHCCMLWAFEIYQSGWDPIPELSETDILRIKIIFDKACKAYTFRIDDHEFIKEELEELVQNEELEQNDEETNRRFKPKDHVEPSSVQVPLTITKFASDQKQDVVNLIYECGMREFSKTLSDNSEYPTTAIIPKPNKWQLGILRNILALAEFDITIGNIHMSS